MANKLSKKKIWFCICGLGYTERQFGLLPEVELIDVDQIGTKLSPVCKCGKYNWSMNKPTEADKIGYEFDLETI